MKLTLVTIALAVWATTAQAKYTETMDANGLTKNLGSDYSLVDDKAKSNQSEVFQKAIDELAAAGGGRLIVPKGTYRLAGVRLRSNVHLLIENMDVKDNYTTYCGITLSPTNSRTKDLSGWKVTRATDGTVRNCRIFNASPGYGLTQLHGARSVHFEDIDADGGVALRLETGAVGLHTGAFDITAKNVTCENGRCAVMFGPHSAKNGLVEVEDVTAKSCTYAITMEGFKHNADKPILTAADSRPGKWAHALKEWKADRGIKNGKPPRE